MTPSNADDFWERLEPVPKELREADVEHDLVIPLLRALGHDPSDVRPKVPVTLVQGSKRSKGRRPEADFVVFAGPPHDESSSLMVVEVKAPGQELEDALAQAESYAMALKAPIVMLINGRELQVWQKHSSMKSEFLFSCPVMELRARRAELEQLLSKAALLEHLREHRDKTLAPAVQLHRYVKAEITRIAGLGLAVSRTLETSANERFASTDLLSRNQNGALIAAPSGYGKSHLCSELAAQAMRKPAGTKAARIAFDVPLPDVVAGQGSLLTYAHSRIVPHHPELGFQAFSRWFHEHGAVLCLDAYERVPVFNRPAMDAEIRALMRDHPNSQVFVFSRGSAVPAVQLERVLLLPLSGEQRLEMASALTGRTSDLSDAPQLLWQLCAIPLLLKLIVEYLQEKGKYPRLISELFERWLRSMTDMTPASPSQKANQRRALETIFAGMDAGPISHTDVLVALNQAGLRDEIYDQLIDCGVLVDTIAGVSPVHDGLADYVRSRVLASLDEGQLASRLNAWHADPESLLPVLLAAAVTGPKARQIVWDKLASLTLPRYLDAVRFAEAIDGPLDRPMRPDEVHALLSDLFDGVKNITSGFFSKIEGQIRAEMVKGLDETVAHVRLIGNVAYEKQNDLIISFLRATQTDGGTVEVRLPDRHGSFRSFNLLRLGLGGGAGRYLGVSIVRDAVVNLIDRRRLIGGAVLANERAMSRLQYLQRTHHEDLDLLAPLSAIRQRFQPFREQAVVTQHGLIAFPMSSLLADIESLIESGRTTLDCWWLAHGRDDHEIASSKERMEGFLGEHYRRSVSLYCEIVQNSFPALTDLLPFHAAMPVRWHLQISEGRGGPRVSWRWFPVAGQAEATVTSRFAEDGAAEESPEPYATDLGEALQALGRYRGRYTVEGYDLFPSVGPYSVVGKLDGETPAMRQAWAWLREEIVALFGELPRHLHAPIAQNPHL